MKQHFTWRGKDKHLEKDLTASVNVLDQLNKINLTCNHILMFLLF